MLPDIFKSQTKFKEAYDGYLLNLLKKKITLNELGILILLSAHASFNTDLQKKAGSKLDTIYKNISKEINNIPENLKNDDYELVCKIIEKGRNNIQDVIFKKVNNLWQAQYNQLRTFKPRRTATQEIDSVYKKFDKNAFNFNKPFLKTERFKKCKYDGMDISLFYNKFPFVPSHTLLVPEQEKNHPQFLRKRFHYFVFDLIKNLDGFAMGYNSVGAFASVNHLHFQLFTEIEPLPVCNNLWKHNGGRKEYPSKCFVFESKEKSWKMISYLYTKNIPYNILYTKKKTFIFPMNFQKNHKKTIFPLGFAWIELSGSFINVTKKDFKRLNERQILKEFKLNKFMGKIPF
jgi:ATP adenylyltransferase/5',5'''-P-1,P-4-tetraphosphate phosphorylase II